MLSWEYPPFYKGGLGIACRGLAQALARAGHKVTLFLPFDVRNLKNNTADNLRFISAFPEVSSLRYTDQKQKQLMSTSYTYDFLKKQEDKQVWVGRKPLVLPDIRKAEIASSFFTWVEHYREALEKKFIHEEFDIIHAHDWVTFPAAASYSKNKKIPFVAHIHATEFDRAGGRYGNPAVHLYEYNGLQKASGVITVSNVTKERLASEYRVPLNKIEVVYNALEEESQPEKGRPREGTLPAEKKGKLILFVGRLTLQKGVDWFLRAAAIVAEHDKEAYFVIAGEGEQRDRLIELAGELGILDRVFFTGFASGEELDRLYRCARVLVMPSLAEPFGITALEALRKETPVIISKHAGVAEVLRHVLKVNFWDIRRMAHLILSVLCYQELQETLGKGGRREVSNMCWEKTVPSLENLYSELNIE